MRKLSKRLFCLVFLLGAVLMTEQVSADRICCVIATGACSENGAPHCSVGPCDTGEVCARGPDCSVLAGDCFREGFGCITVNEACYDALDCSPCTLRSESDDSGEESVEAESDDPGEESVEEECDDEVAAQSTLTLTALLIILVIALPAAPMIIRRWPGRK